MAGFTTVAAVRTRQPAAAREAPGAMPRSVLAMVEITGPLLPSSLRLGGRIPGRCLGVRHRSGSPGEAANLLFENLWTRSGAVTGHQREDRPGVLLDVRLADAVDPQQRLLGRGPGLGDSLQGEVGEDHV